MLVGSQCIRRQLLVSKAKRKVENFRGLIISFLIFVAVGADATLNGNIGLYASSSSYSGLINYQLQYSGQYATSSSVTGGQIMAMDMTQNTPANITRTFNDIQAAYNYAAAEEPITEYTPAAGTLDGRNLGPGIYRYNAALSLTTQVTLTGQCGDIFIFQIAGAFAPAATSVVLLNGGVTASTVYWQVGGAFSTGSDCTFVGTVIGASTIALGASTLFTGTGYAATTFALGANVVHSLPNACQVKLF